MEGDKLMEEIKFGIFVLISMLILIVIEQNADNKFVEITATVMFYFGFVVSILNSLSIIWR